MSPLPTDDKADLDKEVQPVYALVAAPGFLPGVHGKAFAACSYGLYGSEDGGITWKNALQKLTTKERIPFTSLVISPNFRSNPFLAAGTSGGVFCSEDEGKTWSPSSFPPPYPTIYALAISPNFEQDNTLFAGTGEDGVFISENRGRSWAAWNFGLLDFNILCLAVSPDFALDETLFAGTGSGIFYSKNGGKSWWEVELPFGYEPVLSLTFISSDGHKHALLTGTENQGVWISGDRGKSWSQFATNVIKKPINAILVSEHDTLPKVLVVSSESAWLSADRGMIWERLLPDTFAGQTISAVIAPQGLRQGATLLCGYIDGKIATIQVCTEGAPVE